MKYWNFKEYKSDAGHKEFTKWIEEQPKEAKAAIHVTMEQVEIRKLLGPPFTEKLSGADDIWELKAKAANIQYRPLFCLGQPGEIIFLIGATKTGDRRKVKWNPSSAIQTAGKRRKLVLADRRYVDEYKRSKK